MAVEAAVLGGDHRLRQEGRHLPQADRLAEQGAEGAEGAAVRRQDRDARPALADAELAGVGQGEGEISEDAAAQDRAPQQQQQTEAGEPTEQRTPASAPRRSAGWPCGWAARRVAARIPGAVAR